MGPSTLLPLPRQMLPHLTLPLIFLMLAQGIVLASGEQSESDSVELVSFELEVQPILAAKGCSTGPCHGKQRGQNGFQLSLLGFDPDFDYAAIVHDARGRRVFPSSANESLLLQKATASVPHGGGKKLEIGSEAYQKLLKWIESGMPRRVPNEPSLLSVSVAPEEHFMKTNSSHQLVVTAHYSDGLRRDVTHMTSYQSNESATVAVDETGLLKSGALPGEASIMARYMNVIATCDVAIPLPGKVDRSFYANLPRNNFVDEHVYSKLQLLGIKPSKQVNDAKFMRRAFIDIIGALPTPEEVVEFLEDSSTDKRQTLIDDLLLRPEYADHWANKWADLLRPNPYRVGIKAVLNYDNWIRNHFRKNTPWDVFVRELLTAKGSTFHNGAVTLFRDRRAPDELTTITSQLFLGIRLECAKCHHHPFEKWSQHDFYRFAAYFARIGRKGRGVSPPISGSEEFVFSSSKGSVTHPTSGETMVPTPLFGAAPETSESDDPRKAMADWITSPSNPYFARTMVNRVWADLLGRGIVDPVDDLRATNPASNRALLDALAQHFRNSEFDIKEVIRVVASSAVYAQSSLANERNRSDNRNFSRFYRKRLRAEVMLDAVAQVTGVNNDFGAMPAGSKAKQLWTHRIGSDFLDTFGRPDPNKDPPCERQEQATVTQALHLMNSKKMQQQVSADSGNARRLAESDNSPEQIVRQLYLLAYSRPPEPEELQYGVSLFQSNDDDARRQATEDLMWALLNTPEFIFKD